MTHAYRSSLRTHTWKIWSLFREIARRALTKSYLIMFVALCRLQLLLWSVKLMRRFADWLAGLLEIMHFSAGYKKS